jgi:hypothetical protein
MTASLGIGMSVMGIGCELAGGWLLLRGKQPVSTTVFAGISPSPLKKRGFLRRPPGSLAVFPRIISQVSPDWRSEGLTPLPLVRYWSGIVVDLSRPACGHVKKALKGREF